MRALAVLATASLAACLIAPARPGAPGDGGGDDDGGVPPGSTCFGSGDVADSLLVADVGGSGYDTLFRGGITEAGSAVVWRFAPPVLATRCATESIVLGGSAAITSIDALAAVDFTENGDGFHVLASTSGPDPSQTAIHDLVLTGDHYAELATIPAPGLAPQPIAIGGATDTPAFLTYISQPPQLWLGGGSALGVAPYGPLSSAAAEPGILAQGSAVDAWYGVASLTAGTNYPAALVGAEHDVLASASTASGTASIATDTLMQHACTNGPCGPRLARTVSHRGAPDYALVTALVATGDTELVDTGGSVTTQAFRALTGRPGAPYQISDLDLDDLDGDATFDLIALWANPATPSDQPIAELYPDLAADPANSAGRFVCDAPFDQVSRVAAVRFGAVHAVLLLSTHPGRDTETCLVYNGSGQLVQTCAAP